MKKLKMISQKGVTFEEGCNLYLNNCKERNLREGTINHYRQSYLNFYKFFDKEMSLSDFTEKHYSDYILHLRKTLSKILGHSNLQITQNYINLLVSDIGKEAEALNLIDKFSKRKRITF